MVSQPPPLPPPQPISRECASQVRRVMRERAISVNLRPEVEEACLVDLSKHCLDKTEKEQVRFSLFPFFHPYSVYLFYFFRFYSFFEFFFIFLQPSPTNEFFFFIFNRPASTHPPTPSHSSTPTNSIHPPVTHFTHSLYPPILTHLSALTHPHSTSLLTSPTHSLHPPTHPPSLTYFTHPLKKKQKP